MTEYEENNFRFVTVKGSGHMVRLCTGFGVYDYNNHFHTGSTVQACYSLGHVSTFYKQPPTVVMESLLYTDIKRLLNKHDSLVIAEK